MSYAVCKAQYLGGMAPATVHIEYHQVHFRKVCCAGVGCSNGEQKEYQGFVVKSSKTKNSTLRGAKFGLEERLRFNCSKPL